MPKRVRRTAAQIAASRRNLEKARRAKALKDGRIPTGKNVLLIHRTSTKAAESIVAQQMFKPRAWGHQKPKDGKVFFTPASSKSGRDFYSRAFGKAAVSVRVSRKVMKPDDNHPYVRGEKRSLGSEYRRYGAVTVDMKHLAGVKIRRHY